MIEFARHQLIVGSLDMKYHCITLFAAGLALTSTAFANSKIITSHSFQTVKTLLKNTKHPKNTLLALDDDDTLTMMPCPNDNKCQYLGGPAWFSWQTSLPKNSPDKVANSFSELLGVNRILFSLSEMPLVQKDIPTVLEYAQDHGVKILAATARGYQMAQATMRQFQEDRILKFFKDNAIITPKGGNGFVSTYLPERGSRKILYQNGMLYLAGQNKGLMLKDFLKKTNMTHKITHIIFVDDTLKNDQQVAAAYQHDQHVTVTCIYYTHLKTHKLAFTKGLKAKELQEKATKRWHHIAMALKDNLPGFTIRQ